MFCFGDLYYTNADFLIHIQVTQIKFTMLLNHHFTEAYSGVLVGVFVCLFFTVYCKRIDASCDFE